MYQLDGNSDLFSPFLKINAQKILLQDSCDAINKQTASFSEPIKLESHPSLTNLHGICNIESQNTSLLTMTSNQETPTSKNESSSELKNYIKMVAI